MYELIRSLSARQLILEQAPVFIVSLGIAEILYKFHSFLMETLAFLATWFIMDFIVHQVAGKQK